MILAAPNGGSATDIMRVRGSGKVLIGLTDHFGAKLGVDSFGSGVTAVSGVSGNGVGVFGFSTSSDGVNGFSTSGNGVSGFSSAGNGISGGSGSGSAGFFSGNVQVTGLVCAANVPCPSDQRLKQKIKTLQYGLHHLLQLRPVSWTWKEPAKKQLQFGLIAQEVEGVIPELILRETNLVKPLGLNYIGLVPVAIKAIQEQQAQIETQQTQIKRQREQIKRLESKTEQDQRQMRRQQEELENLKYILCLSHPRAAFCKARRNPQ